MAPSFLQKETPGTYQLFLSMQWIALFATDFSTDHIELTFEYFTVL